MDRGMFCRASGTRRLLKLTYIQWEGMKHHTQPPYHLTLKSNGCLILISALSPNHLVVASKHSLGTTTESQDQPKPDAEELLVDGVKKLDVQEGKGKGKATEPDEHSEARQHAEVGRMWLKRTLEKSGKKEQDLAKRLWDEGLTAVLEVSPTEVSNEIGRVPVLTCLAAMR